ncbi:MAG: hypothetical protein Q7O66_01015 [Dehalococcoidia bacterium]|nr:hypothetical protein [Dehalococcoidia bacterium]
MSLTFMAVVVLIIGGSVTIISSDWRLCLISLSLQYVAVAVLMVVEIIPELGMVRLLAGLVAVLILAQSFKRASHYSRHAAHAKGKRTPSAGLFLRVAVVMLAAIISIGLAQSYPMPDFSPDITISAYWLVFSSVSSLVLSQEVSRVGFALLMLELAASLVAGVMVETANLARFLLSSLTSIVLALAVGYLVGLDRIAANPEEEKP